MRDAVSRLELDLDGMAVLLEAASGPFCVTPVIAGLAGASRVIAMTRDSRYAGARDVIELTRALECACEIQQSCDIVTRRELNLFAEADIVMNLGFVRPVDANAVNAMKQGAAVPLVYEAWELRAEDVDVNACRQRGVHVAGTCEDHPAVNVFEYSGWLAMKLLFEAGIEIHQSNILIVGDDKFGGVILARLERAGAGAALIERLTDVRAFRSRRWDAVIIADFSRQDCIIGDGGDLSVEEFLRSGCGTVVQFAGRIDVKAMVDGGVMVFPPEALPPQRMSRTLADLGPRPVIDLHAAGLKVGEVLRRLHHDPHDSRCQPWIDLFERVA